jgi:hypothetical protein
MSLKNSYTVDNILVAVDGIAEKGKVRCVNLQDSDGKLLLFSPQGTVKDKEEHLLTVTVHDRAGNISSVGACIFRIARDVTPPCIVGVSPSDGSVVRKPPVIEVVVDDDSSSDCNVHISLDGSEIPAQKAASSRYNALCSNLEEGKHLVSVKAVDAAGNESKLLQSVFIYSTDQQKPVLKYFSPSHLAQVDGKTVKVVAQVERNGSALDPSSIVLTLDGDRIDLADDNFDPVKGKLVLNLPVRSSRRVHLLGFNISDYGGNSLEKPHVSVFFTEDGTDSASMDVNRADSFVKGGNR